MTQVSTVLASMVTALHDTQSSRLLKHVVRIARLRQAALITEAAPRALVALLQADKAWQDVIVQDLKALWLELPSCRARLPPPDRPEKARLSAPRRSLENPNAAVRGRRRLSTRGS